MGYVEQPLKLETIFIKQNYLLTWLGTKRDELIYIKEEINLKFSGMSVKIVICYI